MTATTTSDLSLRGLLRRYWKRAVFTWGLVIADGLLLLLFPLLIGRAVEGMIGGSFRGLLELGVFSLLILVTGSARRFYDTRVYSEIYREVSGELVQRETARGKDVSTVAARARLLTEFVEFLENSLPDILIHLISLFGTLVILAIIDLRVFGVCLVGGLVTGGIYAFSEKRILWLNRGQNDELERQVSAIDSRVSSLVDAHFRRLLRCYIRLSDLVSVNYAFVWLVQAAVMLASIVIVAREAAGYGTVIAVGMYVFELMESVMTFPLYFQQLLRLREIGERLGRS